MEMLHQNKNPLPHTVVEFNISFVRAVEKHPCIYNPHVMEYTIRQNKVNAWNIIAGEVDRSVEECKMKWRNLRMCYTEYIRKFVNDTPDQLKARSYLTEVMQFLRPFIKTQDKNSKCDKNEPMSDIFEIEVINLDEDKTMDQPIPFTETEQNDFLEFIQKEELDISAVPSQSPPQLLPQINTARIRCVAPEDLAPIKPNNSTNYQIQELENNVDMNFSMGAPTNSRLHFLLSILPDVERMNDRQMRKFRSRISAAIEEILDK